MTVFWRYWLLQVPGWGILAAVLVVAHRYFSISLRACLAVFGLWLLKDLALYPILARHYVVRHGDARDRLVGARGVARERLSPRGYVALGGELWLAEAEDGPIAPGEEVVVDSAEGLKLRVRRPRAATG